MIMWQSVWKTELSWEQPLERTSCARVLIREISSFFLEEGQAVTDEEEQPDLPKFTPKNLLRHAEQKYKKVIRRQSVRSRDCSAGKKSAV